MGDMTTTQIATNNLAEFDAIVAKAATKEHAVSPERRAAQHAFFAACREWLAKQTEPMSAVYAIQTFAKANPELYPV